MRYFNLFCQQTAEELSKLSCHYLIRKNEPYVTLQRYKIEVQSIDPLIWTIYDVITPEETNFMKMMAARKVSMDSK